ncbi:MAG TPA: succinate dehydrogenase assembly factor 2 [Lichenihabitans sp.]|jgi:antitoxin CptB|nr:succinate dehydrogenase assembly factor 2 [Lichenihabitans sp.]
MTAPIDPDIRRRRIAFRAWHRGTREMDLILGRFADVELSRLSAPELDAFEALMEHPDPELYRWVSGEASPPPDADTPFLARLRSFHKSAGSR